MRYRRINRRRKMTPRQQQAQDYHDKTNTFMEIMFAGFGERLKHVFNEIEYRQFQALMEEHLTPAVHEAARADLIYENSLNTRTLQERSAVARDAAARSQAHGIP